jgi:hypothetical protein
VIQTTGGKGGGDPVFLETIHCKLPIFIYLLHTANNASAEDRDTEREGERDVNCLFGWPDFAQIQDWVLCKTKALVSYGTMEEEV